jgi:hypothetical protein
MAELGQKDDSDKPAKRKAASAKWEQWWTAEQSGDWLILFRSEYPGHLHSGPVTTA